MITTTDNDIAISPCTALAFKFPIVQDRRQRRIASVSS